MYAFFQEHLNNPGNPEDEEVITLDAEEIRVTPSGQLATSFKGETVFSLNRKDAEQKIGRLKDARQNPTHVRSVAIDAAKRLSGYEEPADETSPVFTGGLQRDGYRVEKYFASGEGSYVIPYLLMVPEKSNGKTLLYLHPSGKGAEASAGGEIEWFVRRGFTVLAPDLLGVGEMDGGEFTGDAFINNVSHNVWYGALLIARSIVGIQAGDLARLIGIVKKRSPGGSVYAMARKEMTPLLVHAAAFISDIERVALLDPLTSYRSLVMARSYHSAFITGAVPAALTAYDLPDLAATMAPRKLLIGGGQPEREKNTGRTLEGSEDVSVVRAGYHQAQADSEIRIVDEVSSENFEEVMEEWIK